MKTKTAALCGLLLLGTVHANAEDTQWWKSQDAPDGSPTAVCEVACAGGTAASPKIYYEKFKKWGMSTEIRDDGDKTTVIVDKVSTTFFKTKESCEKEAQWWTITKATDGSLTVCAITLAAAPTTKYEDLKNQGNSPEIQDKGNTVFVVFDATSMGYQYYTYFRTKESCEQQARINAPPPPASWSDWLREKIDDVVEAAKDRKERQRKAEERTIWLKCRAASATDGQAAACFALKTGR
jgi:hypothetical protein